MHNNEDPAQPKINTFIFLKNTGEIKIFSDEGKLREFIVTRSHDRNDKDFPQAKK